MRYFIMSLEILSSEGIPWSPIFFALSIIDETSLIMLSLLLSCAVLPDPLFEPLSDPLLDRVQPRLIVVQDLEFPVSERCRPKARDRLAKRNVPVIYTSSAGSVTIEFRGRTWGLRAMNGIKITSDHLAPLPQETVPMEPEAQSGSEE